MRLRTRKLQRGKPRPSLSRALFRQWRMGMLLQEQAWTCAGLAAELGISKATAQRDLDILRRLFMITTHTDRDHLQRVLYRMRGRFVGRRQALKVKR